ncbi:MAG: FAD-binding protein [Gemmatimonadota bacterium]|nr:FAD-binding protein [Gemmatimonadota bacterium]MDH3422540.1 FAD-binding protein [Gemmatimonadota bacterium]
MTKGALAAVLPAEALASGVAGGALAELEAAAEAVVRPESTDEVADTLQWATTNSVGVLPVGSGERLPKRSVQGRFIVLATDRLAGFEIYEPADLTLTAKAGTRLSSVNEALGAHRQWLPFDPPGVASRTLGGLVAMGESGPVATGYGELRSHVLGATVVTGDGRVLRLGGRVVKNVAGFDLLRPVVGSRGRLGVITSICLRAFPVPAVDRLLIFRAADVAGLEDVARAVRTAPTMPASVVVWAPTKKPAGEAALLVRLHGALPTVDADQATLQRSAGVVFESPADAAGISATVRDHAIDAAVGLRMSLLPSRLFEGLAAARDRLGDIMIAADAYNGSARLAAGEVDEAALVGLRDAVEALGGTLTVTRAGDGHAQPSLGSRPNSAERELAERLAKVFDPEGVFWPCRA